MPIVTVQPSGQFGSAFIGGVVGARISPLTQRSLNEALGLSIGLGRVGPGPYVFEAELLACLGEGLGTVAGAVVGHDTLDRDTQACIVGDRRLEKGHGAGLPLVLHHPAESDPGGVVDTDVDELPADAAALVRTTPVTTDAVADAIEFAEFFDVDVD